MYIGVKLNSIVKGKAIRKEPEQQPTKMAESSAAAEQNKTGEVAPPLVQSKSLSQYFY